MTGCSDMVSQPLPFREGHERRLARASTPNAAPHNETRASKPGCTVGANLQNAVQHLSIELGHIKGDKSTSSSQGQLAARGVSCGGGNSRWLRGSTNVAKTIHPPLGFLPGENRSSVFFLQGFVLQPAFNASPNTRPMIPSASPPRLGPRRPSLQQTVRT